MKLVGTMALYWFPFWELSLLELSRHVDELYIRVDPHANPDIPKRLAALNLPKIKDVLYSNIEWDKWRWREELMRMADRSEPDAVLNLDDDEIFQDTIVPEVRKFLGTSGMNMMMFRYVTPLPTIDGTIPNDGKPYPGGPHAKVYRWKPGITFRRYRSYAQASNLRGRLMADTKIIHYSHFTKELRDNRRKGHQEDVIIADHNNASAKESDGTSAS